jgi:hypothetical protein
MEGQTPAGAATAAGALGAVALGIMATARGLGVMFLLSRARDRDG